VPFPIQKWKFLSKVKETILSKVKETNGLRGGGPWFAAQAIPPIDAEIGPKEHL